MGEIPLLGQGAAEKPEREAEFALMLIKMSDGTTVLSTDLDTPLKVSRSPGPGEVLDALHNALENIKAQQVAAVVLNGMVNMSQMAMQAQQNQDILSRIRK